MLFSLSGRHFGTSSVASSLFISLVFTCSQIPFNERQSSFNTIPRQFVTILIGRMSLCISCVLSVICSHIGDIWGMALNCFFILINVHFCTIYFVWIQAYPCITLLQIQIAMRLGWFNTWGWMEFVVLSNT